MSLRFCSLSSGSSGNCYVVYDESTAILVDAGISGKRILEGLERIEIPQEMVKALVITHEHIDHVKSVKVINKRIKHLLTYANALTWQCIDELVPDEKKKPFMTGTPFKVGDIEVNSFHTSHDAAESVGYSFRKGSCNICVMTDTGFVTDEAYEIIKDADLLVLEANHDPQVLRVCGRPLQIIRRIAGDNGHLSNEAAAECIIRMVQDNPKDRQILLGHLSGENNSPELATLTIKNILEEKKIYIGEQLNIDVIVRDKLSSIYQVNDEY